MHAQTCKITSMHPIVRQTRALGAYCRSFVVAIALCATPVPSSALVFSVQDLGSLASFPWSTSTGYDINEAGHVVGWSYEAATTSTSIFVRPRGFFWKDGAMVNLGGIHPGGESFATGINDLDAVVGTAIDTFNSADHPYQVVWNASKPTIGSPQVFNDGSAKAINNVGQVLALNVSLGLVTVFGGGLPSWTDFGITFFQGDAWDINSSGAVIGANGETVTRWTNGIRESLFPGVPYAISDAGVIVGSLVGSLTGAAFRYDGGAPIPIPGMNVARGVNNAGQIVGYGGEIYRAMLWDGVLYDLNDLLLPGSQVTLRQAFAVNDSGQIVANGTDAIGQDHAYLLSPIRNVPEPPTALILGLAPSLLVVARHKRLWRCAVRRS